MQPGSSHLKGLSPLWILRCRKRCSDLLNFLSQPGSVQAHLRTESFFFPTFLLRICGMGDFLDFDCDADDGSVMSLLLDE